MSDDFQTGDHWLIDEKTGTKILRSDARQEWDGTWTHKDRWTPRHPQDFVKAKREGRPPDVIRSRPTDTFIGPLTTLFTDAAVAGATILDVESTVRMMAGDRVRILCAEGTLHQTTIAEIIDPVSLRLTAQLPAPIQVGGVLSDLTALAEPTLP